MVLDDIKILYPIVYQNRNSDKLNHKYPNGDSYLDLQDRVYKVLDTIDMDTEGTLLIVAHQAVCRLIHFYFTQTPVNECTNIQIDLHALPVRVSEVFLIKSCI